MMTMGQLLEPIARHRTNEVVVTTMSSVRPWGRISDHDLDFASADSAMGHAADLALGVALAAPDRRTICINGDGSMLMCLGTLATIVESGAKNLVLIVCDNGVYEITGRQAVAASGKIDYAALGSAVGFERAFSYDDARTWAEDAPEVLSTAGPTLVHVHVEAGSEGPIGRNDGEAARYLKVSLATWSARVRSALVEGV